MNCNIWQVTTNMEQVACRHAHHRAKREVDFDVDVDDA